MSRLLSIVAIFLICCLNASGQVTVMGHISAEVVESVALVNDLETYIRTADSESAIQLGAIRIPASEQIVYHLSIEEATIYNDRSVFQIISKELIQGSVKPDSGNITFTVHPDNRMTNGDYDSNLSVIVSFN
jgi:hypothetical protein